MEKKPARTFPFGHEVAHADGQHIPEQARIPLPRRLDARMAKEVTDFENVGAGLVDQTSRVATKFMPCFGAIFPLAECRVVARASA